MALDTLDRADLDYRIAYSSEHCAGQKAALLADLAVAPLPKSLARAPLRELGADADLPPLGRYHVALVRREDAGRASEALAGHVVAVFRDAPPHPARGRKFAALSPG